MLRALAATVVALALAPAGAAAQTPLERFVPVVVHDSRETSPLTSVEAVAGRVPGVPEGEPVPTVYGRRAGQWLQYWMFFAQQDQDRGILRTGRHAGDWEVVQYAVRDGVLIRGVYSQHRGAERCPAPAIRTTSRGRPLVFVANGSHAAYFVPGVRDRMWPDPNDEADGEGLRVRPRLVRITADEPPWMTYDGRPLVFVANGSHAAYFAPGVRDRMWPDPNDEADGKGLRVRPRLVRITADEPPWMTYDGRWGGADASFIPGEADSPRGPAFQPSGRWSDPTAWARSARSCTREDCNAVGECDQPETALAGGLALGGALLALVFGWRRSRRAIAPEDPEARVDEPPAGGAPIPPSTE